MRSLLAQIKPNPHFMLFATQNPPGTYGGRKVRSSSRGRTYVYIRI